MESIDCCPYCGASDGDDVHVGDCPVRLLVEVGRLKASALVSLARITELMRENARLKALLEERDDKA